jgi:uncharacterized OB-fold protein
MDDMLQKGEPIEVPGRIIVPYQYSVGRIGSKFMVALRDDRTIMGIRCATCDRVYVPPRAICSRCFGQLDQWVELEGPGTLRNYTVIRYALPIHPVKPPFAYGIIQLDGADTALTHLLGDVDVDAITMGMRLQPVFRDERQGNILDIAYFRPLAV